MSLGIATIHKGKAYIASDRKISVFSSKTGAYISGYDEVKLHKLGKTCYTILGVEPLRTWIKDYIGLQGCFNISEIVEVCKGHEALFRSIVNNKQDGVDWAWGGDEPLTIIWGNNNPEVGIVSSDKGYKVNRSSSEGKILSKSAINTSTMLPIILRHFKAGHPSMIHIFGHIFEDSSKISDAISEKFDFAIMGKDVDGVPGNKSKVKVPISLDTVPIARIISDSEIDVTTDLKVGSRIYMQANNYDGGIYFNTFNSNAKINVDPGGALLFGTPIYTPSIHPWNGDTGTFKDKNDKTIQVKDGIITSID